jgi:hypothetical protein
LYIPFFTLRQSMSVCHTCHVPYTRRDIYALNLGEYLHTNDRKYGGAISPYPTNHHHTLHHQAQTNGIGLRGRNNITTPHSPDSPLSSSEEEEDGMTVPALLQRIRDLEAAVNHRDSQIREWRKYVNKFSVHFFNAPEVYPSLSSIHFFLQAI